MRRILTAIALAFFWITTAHGQDNAAELANKLSNPVADLISIPFFSSTTMTASVPPRMVHNIT